MFGKGVYFADMVSKSANYCHAYSSNPIGLMLLCEVALGNMYELTGAKSITKLPQGKHSTKGKCCWIIYIRTPCLQFENGAKYGI